MRKKNTEHKKQPISIGIALRYSDGFLDKDKTTVNEHNKLIHKAGKVWLGKFGVPIKSRSLAALNEPSVQATLVLIRSKQQKDDNLPRFFAAPVCEARNVRPPKLLIPPYYQKRFDVDTWFCLNREIRPLSDSETKSWVIVSSGEGLLAGIRYCPRPFFVITKMRDLIACRKLLERFGTKSPSIRQNPQPLAGQRLGGVLPPSHGDETFEGISIDGFDDALADNPRSL